MIIVGWAFMNEVNISPPLSLVTFFLTQQLIYESKIEKRNVISDIFVSDTSIVTKLHLPVLEEKHFSYRRTHTIFFGSDLGICVAYNQRKFEDQGLIIEVKKLQFSNSLVNWGKL